MQDAHGRGALAARPAVVVFDSRSRGRVRARGAPPAEERFVHGRRAGGRRLRRRSRVVRRRLRAGADEVVRAHRDSIREVGSFASTPCCGGRTATSTSIRRRAFRAPWRSRRRSRRRLELDLQFATCYADLDHFKEFNDRYSYYEGDRVIRILAQILHDVVKGLCHEDGFVGHIGGDDFIFIIPLAAVNEVAPRSCPSSTR